MISGIPYKCAVDLLLLQYACGFPDFIADGSHYGIADTFFSVAKT